jgi:outer membrane protein assembly factor BamB
MTLLLFVFVGLAVYHFRRLDGLQVNPNRPSAETDQKLAAQPFAGYDWPQWRGPNRDGVSTETAILSDWPPGGPKVLWQAKTGEGFASVAVAKERVFTIFQDGDFESIVSWNAETGKEIWRYSYPERYINSYGNGPRSTPSIDGDYLFAVGAKGSMHCLKAFSDNPHGELVWEKKLLTEFGAETPRWGVSFSPLVEGERIYIMPGGPGGNSLAALDKRTGAVVWKQHDDLAGYSSPIAATFHNKRQILFLTGNRLISVDPDSGVQLWDYSWPVENECNIATPIVEKDYVFIASGYGRGYVMMRIDKDGDMMKPRYEHKNRKAMRNHFSTCVRCRDHLYGFDDSTLMCMNFLTGKIEWKERGQARGFPRGFDKGSVLLVNDHLIIYGASGVLALAEANPTAYVEKSRFQFSAQTHSCWSVPVVSNGRLYVRDQERLVCFDVKQKN